MKKLSLLILISIVSICCFTSCTTRQMTTGWAYSAAPAYGGNSSSRGGGDQSGNEKLNPRVVIYNARLSLETKNSDSINNHLARLANKYEGYVLSIGSEKSVIRVKAIFLSEAIKGISASAKLREKSISGEDVTEEYYDSKVRLDNAHKARLRYLELLAKAENVSAALMVEKELERINREIDVLEGKLKRLAHLSEYSTITVNMEKKVKPGILGYVFVGLYKGVKWLFVRG